MISICDLKRQYQALKSELDQALQGVCASGQFIRGPELEAFEREIANYLEVPYALGLNSGTDALLLALKALGVGPGDEVITTAMSFVATAEAISLAGAEPVFVDILNDGTDNLNPELLAAAIGPRTQAIMPVHLHGYPCDMDPILELAQKHGLKVIEDCAQSIGARYRGRQTGSLGDLGCFSFFPTKNLGAFGDGGLICTHDPELYAQLRMLREHGSKRKNVQEILGFNSRLDAMQAAVLRVKLPHLEDWNRRRRHLAAHYDQLLEGLPVGRPALNAGAETQSVFHHYALRVPAEARASIQSGMKAAGFECLSYYPEALPRQGLYRHKHPVGSFPEAEACADQTLSLPLFPELQEQEQEAIVAQLQHLLTEAMASP